MSPWRKYKGTPPRPAAKKVLVQSSPPDTTAEQGLAYPPIQCRGSRARVQALLAALSIIFSVTFSIPGQLSGADIGALIKQMTLDEKISLVRGAHDPRGLGQAGYWPGLPRLGIPPMRLADGPPGVRVNEEATAMPAPIGLGATFDSDAARRFGIVTGSEAKALEQDILLSPHINIIRDPLFRRNHTTLSEDPLLSARLGTAVTLGIQSQGVMAQVKHLAGYNGSNNVIVDERTLHEIYLLPFEAAIRAGAASVMCSYNMINGYWACENGEIQNDILRKQWDFTGFVTSDWGALHGPLAITRGVDMEMPGREILGSGGGPYFTETLKDLVEQGEVPVSVIDQAVSRILNQMNRFHLLSGNSSPRSTAIDIEKHAIIIQNIAEKAAVLLKNEGNVLPLTTDDLSSLAVIGPTAGQLVAGIMTERGSGFQSRLISPLTALKKLAPGARVHYQVGDDLSGVPISGAALSHDGNRGLLRTQIDPATDTTRLDTTMDFEGVSALQPDTAYAWTGWLDVPEDGSYTFMIQAAGGAGVAGSAAIKIDGRPVLEIDYYFRGRASRTWSSLLPTTDGRNNHRRAIDLKSGRHRIDITADSMGETPLAIRFAWVTPEIQRENITAAVEAARNARAVILFAWNEGGYALSLPGIQDELIRRVAAANPRTIVVLNTGGPVAMPWKDNVPAILETWYPGQEGGWSTANLLLGAANPSGKLPVTFPAKLSDTPVHDPGHPERWDPNQRAILGGLGRSADPPSVTFSEGIAVGYRWYDQQNIQPLFPFGHGLSYTRFQYSNIVLRPTGEGFDVTFSLSNDGSRQGAEIPQVYVGPIGKPPVPMVPKSLADFQRVELKPGESRQVTLHIDKRALSYWSIEKHGWVIAHGSRSVYVGSSSRDIRLQGEIRVPTSW